MKDSEPRPTERLKRGAEETGRGIREMGTGVRDATVAGVEAAVAGLETVKDSVRNVMPPRSEPRDKVVMVRVGKDSLDRMDDLVEAGVVGSRSEAADYLINEGIRAKRSFFKAVEIKVGEIRKAKEELRRLSDEELAVD